MRKILSLTLGLLPGFLFAQNWSTLGLGTNQAVTSLSIDDNETNLFVGGHFDNAGVVVASKLANWDGGNWTDLGADLDYPVHATAYIDSKLYVGGEFLNASGSTATRIAVLDNGTWTTLGNGLQASVNTIISFNNEIYAGTLTGLYKWNGSTWVDMSLSGNPYAIVTDMAIFQGELIVVGAFAQAGGTTVNGLAKWNGTAWSSIGSGANNLIDDIQIWNNELYIGGLFTSINGIAASGLAKWDGSAIQAVGTGVPVVTIGFPNRVSAMEVYNGELYVGGYFQSIDGVSASNIASYDGTTFSPLGLGTNEAIYAMREFQNELIVGGLFTQAGGQSASYVAKWSGTAEISENDPAGISLYPVPTKNVLVIETRDMNINRYTIVSAAGKLVRESDEIIDKKMSISMMGEEAGVYFITLNTTDGFTLTRRFIKE